MKVSNPLILVALVIAPEVAFAQPAASPSPDPSPAPVDSNSTRLLFAPTGRPLAQGEGYVTDHLLVFPGVSYGITRNISISGGVSVIPGLDLDEQVVYVAPKVGKQFSEDVAFSGGLLYGRAGTDEATNLGLGYGVMTLGPPSRSLTFGAGVFRSDSERYSSEYVRGVWQSQKRHVIEHTPLLILGGAAQVSRRIALVSENWMILDDDFDLNRQPFALGIRFLGDRLSADLGVVLVGELLDEGFPLPWVSVSYRFGRSK
jgi:hypothetical protein